jgi:hypothetical protein
MIRIPDASVIDNERVESRRITTVYLRDAMALDEKITASDICVAAGLLVICFAKYAVVWNLEKIIPISKVYLFFVS